ncbi:MAG: L-threonylcarbamoyladenylate synthase [Gammaproteobacteria bacterium]
MCAVRVDIDETLLRLRAGDIVAIPTETVYGLAADARNESALRRIFACKGRPLSNPLIVHLPDAEAADDWALGITPAVRELFAAFWPGPLTLVLPARPDVLPLVTAGSDAVALRVPAHPLARELLRRFGGALCAPSANRSGYVSPTSAEHVLADYEGASLGVLDGGVCAGGIESTIVRPVGDRLEILRPGIVSPAALRAVWHGPVVSIGKAEVAVPGSAPRHYAPRTPVLETLRAAMRDAGGDTAVVVRGTTPVVAGATVRVLPDEPDAYAAQLYAVLRELDGGGFRRILVEALPADEAWQALANRLQRAAHPEPPSAGAHRDVHSVDNTARPAAARSDAPVPPAPAAGQEPIR